MLNYRDFKHFSLENFKEDFRAVLYRCHNSYGDFDLLFKTKVNKHAPKKRKWIRRNNNYFNLSC